MLDNKRVLLTANLPWSETLAQALRDCGAQLFHCDGSDADAAIAGAEETLVGVDCLILGSSVMAYGHVFDTDISSFDAMMERNYLIPWKIAHHFAPRMKDGTIVLVGADYAAGGVVGSAAFAASMGALCDLRDQLNDQYPQVRANLLMAGVELSAAKEPMSAHYGGKDNAFSYSAALTPYEGRHQDIVDAVLYLASDRSGAMRGEGLLVNGGIKALAHAHYTR